MGDFQDVYTSFQEKAFTPLLGNVDANNLCLNELGRDVTSVKDNIHSLTQEVDNMSHTVSSYEKNLTPINQELRVTYLVFKQRFHTSWICVSR